MRFCIHEGLTINPHATLPDGSAEVGLAQLAKHLTKPSFVLDQLAFKAKRTKLQKMCDEKRRNVVDPLLAPFEKELKALIAQQKQHQKVVAVLAPWYEDITLSKSEGYIRRIMEMDGSALKDAFCIYFYECPYYKVDRLVTDRVRDNRLYIRYNTAYANQQKLVETLISLCDICYSHSVLRIIPAQQPQDESRWLNIFGSNTKFLLDAHGAVIEEALMVGDKIGATLCQKAEKIWFERTDACIVLTDAMRQYFEAKYNCSRIHFFKTPVLSRDITLNEQDVLDKSGPLTVVYAGGCQRWQNIPLMQQAIRSRKDAQYHIFVSSPEPFMEMWGNEPLPENVHVKKGTPEEIKAVYLKAHYGLILRDDDPLNRVACPTKMMEYLQFGIVPIVKSPEIGDFLKMGLPMLPVEQFQCGGNLSDTKPEITLLLYEQYRHALCDLNAYLNEE